MNDSEPRSLYICYFGIREPLVHTQVLPYLRYLAGKGIDISLLTFEPRYSSWSSETRAQWQEQLASQGVRWLALPYHRRHSALATAFDIANGARLVSKLVRKHQIDFLHARSHVSAVIGAIVKWRSHVKLIFDIRGFMPEEYVDKEVWARNGVLYRSAKWAERWLLDVADGFVVLTEQARRILFANSAEYDERGRPVEVIPCCVDLARFRTACQLEKEEAKKQLGLTGRRVFAYVGALGGWYAIDEIAEFLHTARELDPSTYSIVLTQSDPTAIVSRLKALGVSDEDFYVGTTSPEEVPRFLRAADIGLEFIKPCYSQVACSPTKFAEYLACGLPVICNEGIGDLDDMIECDGTGVLLREFSRDAYVDALRKAEALLREPDLAQRCSDAASRRFDLQTVGGPRYRRLYERLLTVERPPTMVEQPT